MQNWQPTDDRDYAVHRNLADQLATATATYLANQEGRPWPEHLADAITGIIGVQCTIQDGLDAYDTAKSRG